LTKGRKGFDDLQEKSNFVCAHGMLRARKRFTFRRVGGNTRPAYVTGQKLEIKNVFLVIIISRIIRHPKP
jgi:hypothetical protein